MTPYTAHARIVVEEKVEGRSREPSPAELVSLEYYRRKYEEAFGYLPGGTHWIEPLQKFAILRRAGLPDDA